MDTETTGLLRLPARDIPVPASISSAARAQMTQPRPEGSAGHPPSEDKAAWRSLVAAADEALVPLLRQISPDDGAQIEEREIGGVRVFDIRPKDAVEGAIVLDQHGGGLYLCGGELCRLMAVGIATRFRRRVLSVDYRMPPDYPYPAALDDGMAVYRALLSERSPREIVFHGASAGGNLAAALILRARDEGLPLPAGAVLNTPEVDLTESGDSFQTNLGLDRSLRSLMPVNLLYANGHDLAHPYLSPLFGDFTKGFPPTVLTTGTRDLFLSNTVRMHRALRNAGIRADLHVVEAGGHGGFPGAPEGVEIDRELRLFVASVASKG
jgi:acetyl esterase/lipase